MSYKTVELINFALSNIAGKYPLAMDTIKFPVSYNKGLSRIIDSEFRLLVDIRGWGWMSKLSAPEERQDQIGEMIAELLNGCKPS